MSGDLKERIRNVFDGDVLKSSIAEYVRRPLQVEFAEAVASAMNRGGLHLFEAGTGIGKSIAYIIPALLSERKIFVSTATITLQDQLAKKDVPGVIEALESKARVSVLKGRRNYLCLRKWNGGMRSAKGDSDFYTWAENTEDGDVTSCPIEVSPSLWKHFRSDHLDCTGTACPFRGGCHFFRARSTARKADILILNHHLLVSGLASEEVLPEADVLVIDEGHRLEDAASECLGLALSEGILTPVFDGIAFSDLDPSEKAPLLEKARSLSGSIAELTEGITETAAWDPVKNMDGLEKVRIAAMELVSGVKGNENLASVAKAATSVAEAALGFKMVSTEEYCCFAEKAGKYPVLKGVPLDIGGDLNETVYSSFDTVILTSATLTVAGEFDFFRSRLGAWESVAVSFGSPFDYGSQAVLVIPSNLPPHESHRELAASAWKCGRRLAELLGGRTLMLFTSYRNLKLVKNMAEKDLPDGMKLLVQGDMSRGGILKSFRKSDRGIILGTASFWEGVDMPGRMLQAVIIDRLPFASPGHPLVKARMDLIEKRGASSFARYSLPLAAVRLRQGVGRLIRSLDDTGVVMIMDRRIVTRNYGGVFLRSLPNFRRVNQEQAVAFAMEHCRDSGVSPLEEQGKGSNEP